MKLLILLVSTLLLAQNLIADSFWAAYQKELKSFLRGGSQSGSQLQILSEPLNAKYDIAPKEQSLDGILNAVSKWGAVRDIEEGESLPLQYYDFISNLKVGDMDPKIEEDAQKVRDSIKNVLATIEEQETKCENFYNMYKSSMGYTGTFEDFKKNQPFCGSLNRATARLYQLQMELTGILRSDPDSDIREALENFNIATEAESFPWKERLSSLATFRRRISEDNLSRFQISISKSEASNEQSQAEWDLGDQAFIQNGKGKSFSLSSSSNTFNLDIKAAGYYKITVTPEDWFSHKVIDNHKKGPFESQKIAKDFFGKGNKLSLLPKTMYLVYQPEIVLTVSKEDAKYFETTPKIKIGPFDGVVDSVEPVVKKDDKSKEDNVYEILVRVNDNNPLIVAIDNETL